MTTRTEKAIETVPTKVKCNRCAGSGKILVNESGEYLCGASGSPKLVKAFFGITAPGVKASKINEWKKAVGATTIACDKCPRRRSCNIGTGALIKGDKTK
jgi:Zn finger protein HypA/HybF involved in hydrogenase expression